ncbi:KAT8 regulatory NSL complex subunit 1-like [Tachypleus tridentatus]|uniref:KAT8 regulatory NSL complex subunit 1-like n=1 Tax=Tachypleus tridentatus TaxID=6853 RepID=UPI003FD5AFE7
MWSPVSVRLCCLAAMTPALTGATSKADAFNHILLSPSGASNSSCSVSPGSFYSSRRDNVWNRVSTCEKNWIESACSKDCFYPSAKEQVLQNTDKLSLNSIQFSKNEPFSSLNGKRNVEVKYISLSSSSPKTHSETFSRSSAKNFIVETTEGKKTSNFCNDTNYLSQNNMETSLGYLASANVGQFKNGLNNSECIAAVRATVTENESVGLVFEKSTGDLRIREQQLHLYESKATNTSSVNKKTLCINQINLEKRATRLLERVRKVQLGQMRRHLYEQLKVFIEYQQKAKDMRYKSRKTLTQIIQNPNYDVLKKDIKNLLASALITQQSNFIRKKSNYGSVILNDRTDVRARHKFNQRFKQKTVENNEIKKAVDSLITNFNYLESVADSEVTESSSGGESCDEVEDSDYLIKGCRTAYDRAFWRWTLNRAEVASHSLWLKAQISQLEYQIRQHNDLYRQFRANKVPVTLYSSLPNEFIHNELEEEKFDKCITLNESDLFRPVSYSVSRRHFGSKFHVTVMKNNDYAEAITNPSLIEKSFFPVDHRCSSTVSSRTSSSPLSGEMSSDAFLTKLSSLSACTSSSYLSSSPVRPSRFHPNKDSFKDASNSDTALSDHTSRTAPLKNFRKRKLIRMSSLRFMDCKSITRLSASCDCCSYRQGEILPCILCYGSSHLNPWVVGFHMLEEKRAAFFDRSFHPVLSFSEDIHKSFKLGISSCNRSRQRLCTKTKPKNRPRKNCWKNTSQTPLQTPPGRKLKKSAVQDTAKTLVVPTKYKRKLIRKNGQNKKLSEKSRYEGNFKERGKRARKALTDQTLCDVTWKHSSTQQGRKTLNEFPRKVKATYSGELTASEFEPSSLQASGRGDQIPESFKKRKVEKAFDIDNIVIPYSIASTARVERLHYKEILTPKWRITEDKLLHEEHMCDIEHELQSRLTHENDEQLEDTTDRTYIQRHRKYEKMEKSQSSEISKASITDHSLLSNHSESYLTRFSASNDLAALNWITSLDQHPIITSGKKTVKNPFLTRQIEKRKLYDKVRPSRLDCSPKCDGSESDVSPYPSRIFPLTEKEFLKMMKDSHLQQAYKYDHSVILPAECPVLARPILEEKSDSEWTMFPDGKLTRRSLVLRMS